MWAGHVGQRSSLEVAREFLGTSAGAPPVLILTALFTKTSAEGESKSGEDVQ